MRDAMIKLIPALAIIFGIEFLALSALYYLTPEGLLPTYLPGYEAGSVYIDYKHALASLILAFGLLAFGWTNIPPTKQ